MIDERLLTEVKDAANLLHQLPDMIVRLTVDTSTSRYERRARLRKYNELAVLREIAKSMENLYFTKDSLINWALGAKQFPHEWYAENFIKGFAQTAEQISEIVSIVQEAPFLRSAGFDDYLPSLMRAKLAYERLASMTYEAVFQNDAILEIAKIQDDLMEKGSKVTDQVDEFRRVLDCMY